MFIHIDKAVAFAVLPGSERHAVDAAPRCVAHQIHAIVSHRFFHLFNMGAQVVNAVVIVDAAIFFHFVISAKTVFDNKQRLLITLIQFAKCIAQTYWINLPAPVRRFNIRVRYAAFKTRDRIAGAAFGLHCVGHVIAETKIIAGAFTQYIQIAIFHFDVKSATLPLVQHIGRVIAA